MTRQRRRVVRPSDSPNYRKDADLPAAVIGPLGGPGDDEREVLLDADAEETLSGAEFWEQQRPPHYG